MKDDVTNLNDTLGTIWTGDKLGQMRDGALVHSFILGHLNLRQNAGLPRTFVLNLDSDWGSGKSFFLTRFQQELTARGHIAVYVNAWEDDHSDDPFMAVVTAVQGALEERLVEKGAVQSVAKKAKPLLRTTRKIVTAAAIGGGKQFVGKYFGREAGAVIGDLISGSDIEDETVGDLDAAADKSAEVLADGIGQALIDDFLSQKEARQDFRGQLAALAETVFKDSDRQPPVFVLIDELDRCRPSYAVELLERVKHLFSVENFVFILGSDTEQLSYAIQGLYGGNFDGNRYLKRFIDRTYKFQPVEMRDFIQYTFDRLGLQDDQFTLPAEMKAVDFLDQMFQAKGIELRDIEQMLEMISTFVAVWPWEGLEINLIVLLPLVHERHLNMPGLKKSQILSQICSFRNYDDGKFERIAMEDMVSKINRRFDWNSRVTAASNDFHEWVHFNYRNSIRYFERNGLQPKSGELASYPSLLGQVALLQD